MLDINSLQAFITVARHQSFSKASNSLFITQPAVSKRVQSLEDELNTKLFNRINRQISLTAAGEQLLGKAQELIDQADDLKRYASTLSNEISGTLNIGTSHHIGLHRLPPYLQRFASLYPDVELTIRFNESEKSCEEVEHGETELAIITLPERMPNNLVSKGIWKDELNIVVGKQHPLRQAKNVSTTDLLKHRCVLLSSETETYKIMHRALKLYDLELAGGELNVGMTNNNLETLKMLVSTGFGWSLLPATMLDESVFPVDIGQKFYRNLGLVSHKKRTLSNSAKAFQSVLRK